MARWTATIPQIQDHLKGSCHGSGIYLREGVLAQYRLGHRGRAGFTAGQNWDPSKAKPVEWVKIHNLPDHVYFNHAQHVNAGKVQCQTCHGPVQDMEKVYQFSDLSMGWCVNCHRETKVNFNTNDSTGNKFYSIYEKFHNDIKSGKMDSVTVSDIGGIECQKCHY